MKKNPISPILAGLILLITAIPAYPAPVEPVRTEVVPYANTIPLMDGIAELFYSDIQTTEIFNSTGYDYESDFNASFQFCYDAYYLYLLVNVTDDVDHSYAWNIGNPWEFDNFEIFLMLDTNTVTTSYSGTTIQLRVCRNLDSVETAGRAARSDYGYYMEGAAAGGWIAEVAVPWTAVLAQGSEPEDMNDYISSVIGFDFSGADSDDSDGDVAVGNRDVQSAWDMDDPDDAGDRTEDLAWNNTSVFGYIVLGYDCCITPGLNLDDAGRESSIQVYPNPAGEYIRIEGDTRSGSLVIYNLCGTPVLKLNGEAGQLIDISGLSSGIYTVVIDGQQSGRFLKY